MKVLFVCSGNINRSAAAKVIFDSTFFDTKHLCRSVGTGKTCKDGNKVAKKMRDALKELGYCGDYHLASRLQEHDLEWADIVITMAPIYRKRILDKFPGYEDKIRTDLISTPDPHFKGGHDQVAEDVSSFINSYTFKRLLES